MIDIRRVRDDFEAVATALERRGVTREQLEGVRALDERRRALITEGDTLRAEQKEGSRRIGSAPPEERADMIAAVKQVSARLDELEPEQAQAEQALVDALAVIPNLPHLQAPDGADDSDAVELSTFGERPTYDFEVRDHQEIGEALGIIDIPRAVRVSGSRFAYLKGAAVLLEFALIRWGLDRLQEHGFLPVVPPVLTREEALFGTAFLPSGADQLYRVERDDLYLVGTSEVPLAGMHMDEILEADQLPLRYGGFSTSSGSTSSTSSRCSPSCARRTARTSTPACATSRSGPSNSWGCTDASSTSPSAIWATRQRASTTARSGCPDRTRTGSSRRRRTAPTTRRGGCAAGTGPTTVGPRWCTRSTAR